MLLAHTLPADAVYKPSWPVDQTASTPKTVSACKKKYKPGKQRTRCIKRLKSTKPGTSCAHPLESGVASDGAQVGDTKDFSVAVKSLGVRGPETEPEPTYFRLEVTLHNPQVEICSSTVTEVVNNLATESREKHFYHPTIGPQGGLSSEFSIGPRIVNLYVEVFGRLTK